MAGATARVGEVHRPETHLIPKALDAVEGGPALTVFGDDYPTPDGTPIRDYIHVEDLAGAHLAALEATGGGAGTAGGAGPEGEPRGMAVACNLGTARGFSVREVLNATASVVGRPVPHAVGPRRAGDPPVLVASNAEALRVLGWAPRRSTLELMIASAWEWRHGHPGGYPD